MYGVFWCGLLCFEAPGSLCGPRVGDFTFRASGLGLSVWCVLCQTCLGFSLPACAGLGDERELQVNLRLP